MQKTENSGEMTIIPGKSVSGVYTLINQMRIGAMSSRKDKEKKVEVPSRTPATPLDSKKLSKKQVEEIIHKLDVVESLYMDMLQANQVVAVSDNALERVKGLDKVADLTKAQKEHIRSEAREARNTLLKQANLDYIDLCAGAIKLLQPEIMQYPLSDQNADNTIVERINILNKVVSAYKAENELPKIEKALEEKKPQEEKNISVLIESANKLAENARGRLIKTTSQKVSKFAGKILEAVAATDSYVSPREGMSKRGLDKLYKDIQTKLQQIDAASRVSKEHENQLIPCRNGLIAAQNLIFAKLVKLKEKDLSISVTRGKVGEVVNLKDALGDQLEYVLAEIDTREKIKRLEALSKQAAMVTAATNSVLVHCSNNAQREELNSSLDTLDQIQQHISGEISRVNSQLTSNPEREERG